MMEHWGYAVRMAARGMLLLFVALGTGGMPLFAFAAKNAMPERFNVNGFSTLAKIRPYQLAPASRARELSVSKQTGAIEREAQAYLHKFPATTGLLLLDHDHIVFEGYQGQGSARSEFYSMSMAKSLTSLTVGKLLCAGKVESLDRLAGDIIPQLRHSNHGKSSLRQLLMMTSNAYVPKFAGGPEIAGGVGLRRKTGKPYRGTAWPFRLGQLTARDLLWGDVWQKVKRKNLTSPGGKFVYSAGDTLVLSLVVEQLTGISLARYFEKMIWKQAGTGSRELWEQDRDGTTLGHSGFQARLTDWGRLALWIMEETKKPGCYGDYLKAATSRQISVPARHNQSLRGYRGYGYQWWTDQASIQGRWLLTVNGVRLMLCIATQTATWSQTCQLMNQSGMTPTR